MSQPIGKPVMVLGLKMLVIITAPEANENAPSSGAPIRRGDVAFESDAVGFGIGQPAFLDKPFFAVERIR